MKLYDIWDLLQIIGVGAVNRGIFETGWRWLDNCWRWLFIMVSLLFYMLKIFHNKELKRKYKDSITLSLFYFTVPIASVPWGPFLGEMKLFYTNSFYKAIHLSPGQRDPTPTPPCNSYVSFFLCFAFFKFFCFRIALLPNIRLVMLISFLFVICFIWEQASCLWFSKSMLNLRFTIYN